jgi:hypothetical protein
MRNIAPRIAEYPSHQKRWKQLFLHLEGDDISQDIAKYENLSYPRGNERGVNGGGHSGCVLKWRFLWIWK